MQRLGQRSSDRRPAQSAALVATLAVLAALPACKTAYVDDEQFVFETPEALTRAAEDIAQETGGDDAGPEVVDSVDDAGDDVLVDTGAVDTGPADAGPTDTGPSDSGPTDTGPSDSGPTDTGPADTGPVDTGPADAGTTDTGTTDTGTTDTGPTDTGPTDTGPTGPCAGKKDGDVCDDGDKCTTGEKCAKGTCGGGAKADCDDGNECIDDGCDAKTGCTKAPAKDGKSCDDGDKCTTGEKCKTGACASPAPCDDGNACTLDACDKSKGRCSHSPAPACAPRPPCSAAAHCKSGHCDTVRRVCIDCTQASDCGGKGKVCKAGLCVAGVACSSGAQCKATQQVCDKKAGHCVDCLIGDDCPKGDHCVAGACEKKIACSSDKACGVVCGKALGYCVQCNTSADCLGKGWCGADHKCHTALCKGDGCVGTLHFACNQDGGGFAAGKDCDDGDECTTGDKCDAKVGCSSVKAEDGAKCGDAHCTQAGTCKAGVCAGGAPLLWTKTVDDGKGDYLSAVQALPGGELVVAGTADQSDAGGYGLLAHLSATGAVKWSTKLGSGGTSQFHGLVVGADGGLVAAGTSRPPTGSQRKIWVERLDAAHKQVWRRFHAFYGGTTPERAYAITALPGGGYGLTGEAWPSTDFKSSNAFALVLDAAGNKVWGQAHGGLVFDIGFGAAPWGKGGLAICGYGRSATNIDISRPWVRLHGPSGKLAAVVMPEAGAGRNLTAMLPAAGGGAVAFGYRAPAGGTTVQPWMLRFDAAGKLALEAQVPFPKTAYVSGAAAGAGGGFVLLGGGTDGNTTKRVSVSAVDASGNLAWRRFFGPPNAYTLRAVATLSDGRLAAVATQHYAKANATATVIVLGGWGHETAGAAGGCCAVATGKCDDGKPCTADGCDAKSGCTHAALADKAKCGGGVTCITGGSCSGGKCGGGKTDKCDDGNVCTADACGPIGGCVTVPTKEGAACDDGSKCTQTEKCSAGTCHGPVPCADGDPCTLDSCDQATGKCSHAPNPAC